MYKRIHHLFHFAQERAYMTAGEIVYAVAVLQKLVRIESEEQTAWNKNPSSYAPSSHRTSSTNPPQSLISDSSLGTLLLLSVMLANKWLRDVPVRNSWWAKTFGVPLSVLNQSELVFMRKLRNSLCVEYEECFPSLCSFIFDLKVADSRQSLISPSLTQSTPAASHSSHTTQPSQPLHTHPPVHTSSQPLNSQHLHTSSQPLHVSSQPMSASTSSLTPPTVQQFHHQTSQFLPQLAQPSHIFSTQEHTPPSTVFISPSTSSHATDMIMTA